MRFSPTKLLHGLLYTAPILLLTLAACGGGGSSTPAQLDVYYTVSGITSGLTGDGLVLLNNGGDAQPVASSVTGDTGFTFPTAINTSYNVTVLSHPDTPGNQKCTVGSGSGPRQSGNISSVTVSCVDAFTISGIISGVSATSTGLVLQNNAGDNYLVPTGATTFTFSTPLAASEAYAVTVLSDPNNPLQTCTPTNNTGTISTYVSDVIITCGTYVPPLQADRYVYAANFGSANVSVYTSASGVLTAGTAATSGSGPYSIAIDPASKYAYVANYNSDSISAYSIDGAGALTPLNDVDAGTYDVQTSIATGDGPRKIVIHPSGKFAYVVNYLSNNVSAYSIDAATGALAKIDANGVTAGNQAVITTSVGPVSIAVHPAGEYVYVANVGSTGANVCGRGASTSTDGCISAYSINATTGALTKINASDITGSFIDTGTTPTSITINPAGNYAYVTNAGLSNSVSAYSIDATTGELTSTGGSISTGINNPSSLAILPGGGYAYVTNLDGGNVSVYTITLGALSYLTQVAAGTGPFSIRIDSTGQYAYVANSGTNDISAYSIGGGGATLTPVNNSPFTAGTSPYDVTTAR